ncbi:hypothetical protein CHGG_07859 [Chaetomium globosum CBS 148.51]|uniref:Uncharacterized protein n=1 Tax=Chaetomium globosum (strain ATCC 6205 / CBS 148.51 / DSM 1962 / NBRC 6347 / NRRL 1970) TaxID=306901 RepID=Q2GVZ5_CHAGB|nr:uncharacterized protein CHGG_07859 [Chaetomium globosum CBS 148.51]EAQ86606.1 hypothetical protein CHGG_07859 [Chaetomium globosum CBS 148.51]
MFAESPWIMQYKMNYTRDHVSGSYKPSGGPYKAASKVPAGQLDPNDLTRRLYIVLAEQKAHAERRRRARGDPSHSKDSMGTTLSAQSRETRQRAAEPPADLVTELRRTESTKHKPAPDSHPEAYHHVPQEAAKQFTRTTTVENMRDSSLVHKLSKHALKFHLEGPKALRPVGSNNNNNNNHSSTSNPAILAPAELTRALQQNQSQRDKLLDRNQFQRTHALEEAAAAAAQPHHPTQRRMHTLEDELSRILPTSSSGGAKHLRRNSTGNTATHTDPATTTGAGHHHARHSLIAAPDTLIMDTLLEDDPAAMDGTGTELGRFAAAERARVDWTQSDEVGGRPSCNHPNPKGRLAPFLPQQSLDILGLLRRHLLPNPVDPHTLFVQQKLDQITKLTDPVARIGGICPRLAQGLSTLAQTDVLRPWLLPIAARVCRDGARPE